MKYIRIQRGNDGIAQVSPINCTICVGETACIDISGVGTFKVIGVPFDTADDQPCAYCPIANTDMDGGCICDNGVVLHDISKIMEDL